VALRGVSDLGGGARVALVALTLVGGRRHQLRAHLAHVGAPLVGDALYGGTPDPHDDGLWLHAASLTIDGVTAHAPLPARWSRWATLDVSPTP
jgi:23S rRNA pseudouridine1911/1915/1917 synthase